MTITQQFQDIVGDRLKEDEPMSKHTNFRLGGPAKWYAEVKTVEELSGLLAIAKENNTETFVFGGGSNMLVSDEGFDGLVIKLAMRETKIEGTNVTADAGVLSVALARQTAKEGLAGFTWAISLPGTIGGAVRGNAGCFGGETRDNLVSAQVLRNGEIITFTNEELEFGYRESAIKHSEDIVLSATFKLEEGDPEALKAELEKALEGRKSSQPLDAGSAGCLFKNYEVHSDEEMQRLEAKLDVPSEMSNARRISAGWLIDQLDLKGFSVGGAKISEKHGNFVVNSDNATADDVVQLIAVVKTRMRNELGIQLQEEVQLVGF